MVELSKFLKPGTDSAGPNDYSQDSGISKTELGSLFDGSGFSAIGGQEVSLYWASEALDRLIANDALFSFIGHGWVGLSGLIFYSVDEFQPDFDYHGSAIASMPNPIVTPGFVVDYINVLPINSFTDVFLAVLATCDTITPDDTVTSLTNELLSRGVDHVVSSNTWLHSPASKHWSREFWFCATAEAVPESSNAATIPTCVEYAKGRAYTLTIEDGYEEWEADSINGVFNYHAVGLSPDDYVLAPARYGVSNNN